MSLEKKYCIRTAAKSNQIIVAAWEEDNNLLVSACEYRKRDTVTQRTFEVKKWESLGYTSAS